MKRIITKWLILSIIWVSALPVYAEIFDFNGGTNQNWTYTIGTDGGRILVSERPVGWLDVNSFPSPARTDPLDDNRGSATVGMNGSALGGLHSTEAYYILLFKSPDLRSDSDWQDIDSLSTRILPSFTTSQGGYYVNVVIHAYDEDEGRERNFSSDLHATELNLDVWNEKGFSNIGDIFSLASPPLVNYTITGVTVQIWIEEIPGDLVFCVDEMIPGGGNTPVGTDVDVLLEDVAVTFENVTASGHTTITQSTTGESLPINFQDSCTPPTYYNIETTATVTGDIEICLEYDDAVCDESDLQLLHNEDGTWVDRTSSVDTANHVICATVSHLSQFVLAAPVALATVWVDDDYSAFGTNDGHKWGVDAFNTIQAGIDAIDVPGSVYVKPGIYAENIILRSQVQVIGQKSFYPKAADVIITGKSKKTPIVTAVDVDCTALLQSVTIKNGNNTNGGGMYCRNAYLTVSKCLFQDNCAQVGAGMYNRDAYVVVQSCTFKENTASDNGGGIYNTGGAPTIKNCSFMGNEANSSATYYSGGGGVYNSYASAEIINCTFSENSGGNAGGGLYNWYSSAARITDCDFENNTANDGGAMILYHSSATVTGCLFNGNNAEGTGQGGGMILNNASPTIRDSRFIANTAYSGAGMCNSNSSPIVENCIFQENSAMGGSGMLNKNNSVPLVINCLFTDNTGLVGAGMHNDDSSPTVINATFSNNGAPTAQNGGAIYNYNSSSPTVSNCIFWEDSPNEIYTDNSSSLDMTYSNSQDGASCAGCISQDPLFVDPGNQNYHLQAASPCIDQGDSSRVNPPYTDFEGDARIIDGDDNGSVVVDMGADEFTASLAGDLDNDKDVDGFDISKFAADYTGSGLGEFAAVFGKIY